MTKYIIEFTALSNQELVDAVEYYESQLPGLSVKFETELDGIIKKIVSNPLLFPNKFKKYREVPLKKFPFVVVYEIVGDRVVIVSIFHSKRNPESKAKKK